MLFFDLISWILFIFLAFYVLNQLYIISCSSRGKIADIEKKNYAVKFQQNINIIVYSHNNASTIIDLIESLKRQEYNPERYSINVIMDNCDDNSAKLLEILGGTRLWRINTDIKPIGRNKAIAWLLERILSSENTNAFVFLNADCIVKPDFLARVNAAIYDNPVLLGETLPLNSDLDLMSAMAYLRNKIKNKVINHGRYYASLSTLLDEDIYAIRQDILEKLTFSITDYGFEEYEFSIKLANAGIPVSNSYYLYCYKQFSEDINSIALDDYKKRYKSLITFKNNILFLFTNKRNIKAKELILSLIYPSSMVFLILSFFLFNVSLFTNTSFANAISTNAVLLLLFGYFTGKLFAMLVARCSFKEYKNSVFLAFFAPLIFSLSLLQGIKINMSFKFTLPKKFLINKDFHKQIIETTVSDGKKELPCQLEIRQNDTHSQLLFIFNGKKLSSSKHPRIDYAIEEITEKLRTHGFNLKVCMNCGYFKLNESIASKLGGEQGYCLFDNINKGSKAWEYSYIWNSCLNIISVKTRKHIQQKLNEIETKQL
ncbi:MAG: Glycosyl transferase [uncultured bacterium]|nr:MAG: Glycosyl transferase [uncultured bacterium]HBH17752.1 hypothetical protein [Cyanobacteria bacterium UBA9579]